MMSSSCRRCAFAVALAAVAGLAPLAAAQPCDYLIVTTDDLAAAFAPLAAHRSAQGMAAEIVTLAEVLATTPPAEDDPATLRDYLASRHSESGVRYVILGGGVEQIPVRLRYQDYGPEFGDRFYPTDLYYACHDGTWNADGDTLYGEAFEDGYFDVEPEVALGRIPARDAADVTAVVDKILAYEVSQADARYRMLMAAPVIIPYPWSPGEPAVHDGAMYSEGSLASLDQLPHTLDLTRMYQNHTAYAGSVPLTGDAFIDSLDTGHYGLVHFFGRSGATSLHAGDRLVESVEFAHLANVEQPFVMLSIIGDLAAFDITGNLGCTSLRNPGGGACAMVSFTTFTYLSLSRNFQDLFYQNLAAGIEYRIGDAWRATLEDIWSMSHSATTCGQMTAFVVLGDPAMPIWPAHATAAPESATPTNGVATVDRCQPNPFNPRTTITYTLSRDAVVRIGIFDARGRLVRRLEPGAPRRAGTHQAAWDGREDRGTAAASGTYVFRVEAGGAAATGRMTLVK